MQQQTRPDGPRLLLLPYQAKDSVGTLKRAGWSLLISWAYMLGIILCLYNSD